LIDGEFKLTESAAINRYIILQSGHSELLGKTAKDRARVDNLLGVLKDALKDIRGLYWNKDYQNAKGDVLEKARTKLDYIQSFIGEKKWALGYLTIADFEIAEASYYFEALYADEYLNWSFWETIRENFNALPEIQAYYKREDSVKEPFLPPQFAALNPKFGSSLILGYWGIRGLAQQIRLVLSYVGLPFEDKIYANREEWFETDKKNIGFAFPNIPYLLDGEFKLTESSAIQRYVINKSQHKELLGKNIQDSVRIETVIGVLDDIWAEFAKNFWKKDE
jgi:glutathione S-transferase